MDVTCLSSFPFHLSVALSTTKERGGRREEAKGGESIQPSPFYLEELEWPMMWGQRAMEEQQLPWKWVSSLLWQATCSSPCCPICCCGYLRQALMPQLSSSSFNWCITAQSQMRSRHVGKKIVVRNKMVVVLGKVLVLHRGM